MENKRIILTGAQGTGKTTILKKFDKNKYHIVTEIVRKLAKTGVKINENGDVQSQQFIYNTYKEILSCKDSYISDRGLTDVLAYTLYLTNHCTKEQYNDYVECLENQIKELYNFYKNNPDVIYIYFPIEFPVEDDGVRSVEEKFRQEIDGNIKKILDMMNVKYLTVSGSVEERYKYILEHL